DVDDLLHLERLEDVVVGAALHRVDGRLHRAEAGHDDRQRVGRRRADLLEQLDAAHARHLQIADHEIVVGDVELAQRRVAVFGRAPALSSYPGEVRGEGANDFLVVDDPPPGALFFARGQGATAGLRLYQSARGEGQSIAAAPGPCKRKTLMPSSARTRRL